MARRRRAVDRVEEARETLPQITGAILPHHRRLERLVERRSSGRMKSLLEAVERDVETAAWGLHLGHDQMTDDVDPNALGIEVVPLDLALAELHRNHCAHLEGNVPTRLRQHRHGLAERIAGADDGIAFGIHTHGASLFYHPHVLDEGDVVGKKYRITGVLGRGGMGVVYSAIDEYTQRPCAVKFVTAAKRDGEYAERLIREAKNAGRIHHRNVVDIFDYGETEHGVFLVMEQLQGFTLTRALDTSGFMPPEQAIGILMPACRGVATAHKFGVLHRDVKPDNIFLCVDDTGQATGVKVLDFGISKRSDPKRAGKALTRSGEVMGTPRYMSPEQLRGKKDLDERSDVYALGCVLYEMLEGECAFDARTFSHLREAKLAGEMRPFEKDLPHGLQLVIKRALAISRDERYADVAAFAEALEPFAQARFKSKTKWTGQFPGSGEHAVISGANTLPSSTRTTIAKRLWVFPALLVGISVLVLLAVAYWQWTVING